MPERTVGIEALGLGPEVEHLVKGARIAQAAGDVLPAQRVALKVRINEHVPKVLEAPLPRQKQVLDEEGRRDHARAVVQPAGRPELPHRGVDEWVAGLALPPRLEAHRAGDPRDRAHVLEERALVREGEVIREVARILAVADLLDERRNGLAVGSPRRIDARPRDRLGIDHVDLRALSLAIAWRRRRSAPRRSERNRRWRLPGRTRAATNRDLAKVDVRGEARRRVTVNLGALAAEAMQPVLQEVDEEAEAAGRARAPLRGSHARRVVARARHQ